MEDAGLLADGFVDLKSWRGYWGFALWAWWWEERWGCWYFLPAVKDVGGGYLPEE